MSRNVNSLEHFRKFIAFAQKRCQTQIKTLITLNTHEWIKGNFVHTLHFYGCIFSFTSRQKSYSKWREICPYFCSIVKTSYNTWYYGKILVLPTVVLSNMGFDIRMECTQHKVKISIIYLIICLQLSEKNCL